MLVAAVLARGHDHEVEVLGEQALRGAKLQGPAVATLALAQGDDLVLGAQVEAVACDRGREVGADLLAARVLIRLEGPREVAEAVVLGDVLEADLGIGAGPDAARLGAALEEGDLMTEVFEDPGRSDPRDPPPDDCDFHGGPFYSDRAGRTVGA